MPRSLFLALLARGKGERGGGGEVVILVISHAVTSRDDDRQTHSRRGRDQSDDSRHILRKCSRDRNSHTGDDHRVQDIESARVPDASQSRERGRERAAIRRAFFRLYRGSPRIGSGDNGIHDLGAGRIPRDQRRGNNSKERRREKGPCSFLSLSLSLPISRPSGRKPEPE